MTVAEAILKLILLLTGTFGVAFFACWLFGWLDCETV